MALLAVFGGYVGPFGSYVGPPGQRWFVEAMLSHLEAMLGLCWAAPGSAVGFEGYVGTF